MMKLGMGLLVTMMLGAGCAVADADANDEPTAEADESELRTLRPGELAGTIACGETKRVRHSGSPTYRALAIAAQKGQALDVRVSAPGHDAVAWLTSASNGTLARNDDAGAGTKDARIAYTAKSTSRHHVVFREKNYEDGVDFDVTLACSGGAGGTDAGGPPPPPPPPPPSSDDPFDATSCQGSPITMAQAIARIGAGNAFKEIAPARKLMARKRSCNPVTGCGAWSAPAPATTTFYMASGGDNYNVARPFDVNLMFSVTGNAIEAVIEDVSNRSHCPGCTPSGIAWNVTTSKLRDHYGDAALFVYYPRWTHTSSGFQLMDTWASVPLGPQATTSVTVTDRCTRASVLSKDSQTEYAALFRY